MKKFTIMNGNDRTDIYMNSYKLIIGDYKRKYKILQNIRSYFSGDSEYEIEKNKISELLINDVKVSKKTCCYEISTFYDLKSDFKLGVKSLITKYLQLQFNNYDYFEDINMINISLANFANSFNLLDNLIKVKADEVNAKNLIKLIQPYILIDDFIAGIEDLSYDEYYMLILNVMKELCNKDKSCQYIFLMEMPVVTIAMLEIINSFTDHDLILIFTDERNININMKYIFLCNKLMLDFADDQMIYNLFCESTGNLYSMEELKRMIMNELRKNGTDKSKFIADILNI